MHLCHGPFGPFMATLRSFGPMGPYQLFVVSLLAWDLIYIYINLFVYVYICTITYPNKQTTIITHALILAQQSKIVFCEHLLDWGRHLDFRRYGSAKYPNAAWTFVARIDQAEYQSPVQYNYFNIQPDPLLQR
jgi:hypothetical protein